MDHIQPACFLSYIFWSTQMINEEILKLSLKKKKPNLPSRQSWLELKSHHSLPYTQHSALIDIPHLSPFAFEFLIFALWNWIMIGKDYTRWAVTALLDRRNSTPPKGKSCLREDLFKCWFNFPVMLYHLESRVRVYLAVILSFFPLKCFGWQGTHPLKS